jgi:hypothetical protein
VWTHMQQILKRATGRHLFMEQGQGVLLMTQPAKDGFTVGCKNSYSKSVKVQDSASRAVAD